MKFRSGLRWAIAAVGLAAALAGSAAAATRCMDQEGRPQEFPPAPLQTARPALRELVQAALQRSQAVGAAALLSEAAQADVLEARASGLPQSSLNLSAGQSGSTFGGATQNNGGQLQAGVNVGAPLYDAGRVAALTSWRTQLAEAARLGLITAQEQVALQTVTLALDLARYAEQVQVYEQYAGKMACLLDALETIVSNDRGRASELVQARKSLQQTLLIQSQTRSAMLQTQERLRRFVGEQAVPLEGLSSVLLSVPLLEEVRAAAARASEIGQLDAQAQAARNYTNAVAAGGKPQIGWTASASKSSAQGQPGSWLLGLTLNVPLLSPGVAPATDAARLRALAADRQRDDALQARLSRVAELHEQAVSSIDRARRVVDVLRDSDRLRNATLQQWQQLGRRSLFDVMAAESDYYGLRVSYVNALYDGEQAVALLWSLGLGTRAWLW